MSMMRATHNNKYGNMDIATSFSAFHASEYAVSDAIRKLKSKIVNPKLILVYFSENYDDQLIQQALTSEFPSLKSLVVPHARE